jgi:hypothetical protein
MDSMILVYSDAVRHCTNVATMAAGENMGHEGLQTGLLNIGVSKMIFL